MERSNSDLIDDIDQICKAACMSTLREKRSSKFAFSKVKWSDCEPCSAPSLLRRWS